MRRREFISLVGGTMAWPLAVRAQQPAGQKRVGILMGTADDADAQNRVAAFRGGSSGSELG
jgi:putative ABC transport system substrate-binding protein